MINDEELNENRIDEQNDEVSQNEENENIIENTIDEENENMINEQQDTMDNMDEESIETNKEANIEYQNTEKEEENEIMKALNDEIIDQETEILNTKNTKEIGIQTIIFGSEIKLGSKTKKRIAKELRNYNIQEETISPITASKQMNCQSSSQKIASVICDHSSQLKVIFDRYSNGLTNKIKLDGLTRMLKDRNILKKISLVPEITKAFHKSAFTKTTPDSLTFDEFLQCIIRLANDITQKKSKYKTAESRVSLFLQKLHLKPFPKNNKNNNIIKNLNNKNNIELKYDYRLTEKQLDSQFDNYFNTGGFFSDARSANSSRSITPNTNTNANNNNTKQNITQIKSQNKIKINNNKNNKNICRKNQLEKNKRVKPSPLQNRIKKTRISSYQQLYNNNDLLSPKIMNNNNNHLQSPLRNAGNRNTQMQMRSPLKNNVYYQQQHVQQIQQQSQTMMSPNAMYTPQTMMMSPPQQYDSYNMMQNQAIYNDNNSYYESQ